MQFGGSGLASARHLGQPVVPGSMPSPTQPSRLICLDSLRGLAALVVLLHHAEKLEPWPPLQHLMQLPWLHPKSAVAFFFVLSGFVLQIGLCCRPASLLECAHFWWRRAWRLYPLFWLSLLLAAGLFFTLPVLHSGLSFPEAAGGTVAAADHSDWRQWLLQASLALPGLDGGFINPPIWTLVVEMRVALLFPMVSLTLRALPLWGGMLCLALSFLLLPTIGGFVAMLPLFVLGAQAAEIRQRGPWLDRMGVASLLLGALLYGAAGWARQHRGLGLIGQLHLAGTGSVLILVAALQIRGLRGWLECAPFALLGRLSYAVYVLHLPLLMVLFWALRTAGWGPAAFHVLSLPVVLVIAALAHRWIELPALALGRKSWGLLRQGGRAR